MLDAIFQIVAEQHLDSRTILHIRINDPLHNEQSLGDPSDRY